MQAHLFAGIEPTYTGNRNFSPHVRYAMLVLRTRLRSRNIVRSILVGGLLLPILGASVACASPNFPFPRNHDYAHGIRSKLTTDSAYEGQAVYDNWLSRNFVDSGATANVGYTSCHLSYAMLVMVYMDNAKNNTQSKFDQLLARYDAHLDTNGLMNYRSVSGNNAATDADLDAAMALLLAYKQWGTQRYLDSAKAMIGHIWRWEVDSTNNLKPGDAWNTYKNPSYLNFAALHMFSLVDANDWASVLSNSWTLLKANLASPECTAHLPSDWCAPDGTPVNGKSGRQFQADAMRVPWRAGIAWSWYGDSAGWGADTGVTGFALSSKHRISGHPDSISYWYGLGGQSASPYPSYMRGTFTSAAMVDPTFQTWLDTLYGRLKADTSNEVYVASLNLLALLYASGNFNDFWDASATSSIQPGPSRFSESVAGKFDLSKAELFDLSGRRIGRERAGRPRLVLARMGQPDGSFRTWRVIASATE